MIKAILLFAGMNALNIILSTIKTLVTVKSGRKTAASVNMITFGVYTYVVILTANGNIPDIYKCIIVAGLNYIFVYLVKLFEEKFRKTKLWKIEATFKTDYPQEIYGKLKSQVPVNFNKVGDTHYVFNCYCYTKEQSAIVAKIINDYNGRYIILENNSQLVLDNSRKV